MKKYLYIGLGGFLGAILRFYIKNIPIYGYKETSINTLFINITGSFILALISTLALNITKISSDVKLGICTGFLGAYTTFSTMCKESVSLISRGYYFYSLFYILASLIFGFIFAYLGVVIGRINTRNEV